MRRRNGQKKIETWSFRVDGQAFEVDVYLVRSDYGRGESTKFVAVSAPLEIKIESTSIDVVFSEVARLATEGYVVEIRGLGVFSRRDYPARTAHNQRTGTKVSVPPAWKIVFRAGKHLRGRNAV